MCHLRCSHLFPFLRLSADKRIRHEMTSSGSLGMMIRAVSVRLAGFARNKPIRSHPIATRVGITQREDSRAVSYCLYPLQQIKEGSLNARAGLSIPVRFATLSYIQRACFPPKKTPRNKDGDLGLRTPGPGGKGKGATNGC